MKQLVELGNMTGGLNMGKPGNRIAAGAVKRESGLQGTGLLQVPHVGEPGQHDC